MTDRHTPEQIDAGLTRLDADLRAYLAAEAVSEDATGPTMTAAEVDEAMRGLPDLKADRSWQARLDEMRDSVRDHPQPGDVAVFDADGLVGYVTPPKMPTYKIGDEITVPRADVDAFMKTLPHLAPAVTTPGLWAPPADSPYAKYLREEAKSSAPFDKQAARDFDDVLRYGAQVERMTGRHVSAWPGGDELIDDRIDRRTRLGWAGECLAESWAMLVEAGKLIVGLWRRYE